MAARRRTVPVPGKRAPRRRSRASTRKSDRTRDGPPERPLGWLRYSRRGLPGGPLHLGEQTSFYDTTFGLFARLRQRAGRRGHVQRDAVTAVRIIHEDERLVVVDKPAGVATAPGGGIRAGESMQEQVANHLGTRAYLVHRLDRETSGLIVFSKTAESHRLLSLQFEDRAVTKRYLALVEGHVNGRSGSIAEPLREFGSGRVGVDPGGREATTNWALRERLPDADLLEVTPVTGRRHQIRVHLYSIGHPILGDTRYGTDRPVGGASRLMLHASELVLADGLAIRAEPAADFIEAVAARRA